MSVSTWNSGSCGVLLWGAGKAGAAKICIKKKESALFCFSDFYLWGRYMYHCETRCITFLFTGRALNLGIFANISSSSSALLFTLTGRARWDVTNSGSFGLVSVNLVRFCTRKAAASWKLIEDIPRKQKDTSKLKGSRDYLWKRRVGMRKWQVSRACLELFHQLSSWHKRCNLLTDINLKSEHKS